MKQKYFFPLAVLLVFILVRHPYAGMHSAAFRITGTVLSGGGGFMTSDSFRADSTLGQPTPLMDPLAPPQSSQYDLFPGFWYALDGGMGCDLASFAATFGLTEADEGYNAACDSEPDGDVDGADLAAYAGTF